MLEGDLRTAASRRAINRVKRRREDPLENAEALVDTAASTEERLIDEQQREHLAHDLDAAMNELSPKTRLIVVLKWRRDSTTRQIAERLGMSESAVKARLHRALQRFRSRLGVDLRELPGGQDDHQS